MRRILIALVALGCASAASAAAPDYRLQATIPIAGKAPAWDYMAFDPASGRLFVARRKDGVAVIDTESGRVLGTVARAEGANSVALVPALGRGFTANEDGSTTIFDLATLQTIDRVKLGAGADAAFFEPATRQVVFTLGETQELVFLDPASGRVTGRAKAASEELEAIAMRGDGTLFVNQRDRDSIARVDARTHKVTATWKLAGCHLPVGLAMDRARDRLFVGCRGEHPVLTVVDARTGKVVAQPEIGRGNDGVVYDPEARRIYTSNGLDANVVMIDQLGPNAYRLAGAFTTRPIARTMAFDPNTKRVFTATGDGLVDPTRPINRAAGAFYPNRYQDDSFAVFVYAPVAK